MVTNSASLNKIKDTTEDDDVKDLSSSILFLALFGTVIQDFANNYLGLDLCYNVEDIEIVKAAFAKFFYEPTLSLQCLSESMKCEIEEMTVTNISEIVNRLSLIYAWFSKAMTPHSLSKIVKSRNKEAMQSVLDKAPPIEDYDEKMHILMASLL